MQRTPAQASFEVDAAARLHLGFVDLRGDLGRRFGSLGLAVDAISTRVRVCRADTVRARGPHAARAEQAARSVLAAHGVDAGVAVMVERAIPEHAGLGSGTQMALAVGRAVAACHGIDTDIAGIATCAARGARSGIGIGTFAYGGFVVDGGRGPHTDVPPLVSRLEFPAAWRVLLVFDDRMQGLNGSMETLAFRNLPPMQAATADVLARRVLMQLLPALAEGDFATYSTALRYVQDMVGDYFAGWQGGRYTSPDVAAVIEWLAGEGICGVGQSSWGPTGFAMLASASEAEAVAAAAERRWRGRDNLRFLVTAARNVGASLAVVATATDAGTMARTRDRSTSV
ncbi:MAG: GHMP kinase [Gammaproteobacteria bacterium]|nr:GHMP kinase [Gammaproteobacteria bacterium]